MRAWVVNGMTVGEAMDIAKEGYDFFCNDGSAVMMEPEGINDRAGNDK